MGIQGALVWAFKIPGVVADALTATLITLGQHFAQDLGHRGPESQEWRWNGMFLALLCLIYVASALVVALTSAFILAPVVPVIIVTIAIFTLLVPARQAVGGLPTSSS
jgi:membrane associated rhomboid family serine protease